MKFNFISCFLLALLIINVYPQTATQPAGGSGTENDPYQIETLDNLYWIASNNTNWDKHYIQIADINAAETAEWFSGEGWIAIGTQPDRFTGSYDGQGHYIDSIYLNRPTTSNQGFFGYTQECSIKNLSLTNADITGNWQVGILSGRTIQSEIENCNSSGNVNGYYYVGGLIGEFSSGEFLMSKCFSTAVITGNTLVGGLVGNNSGGRIFECYAIVSVSGKSSVGGLAGGNRSGSVSNSFSEGTITGNSYCGGLVGFNSMGITNSYSKCVVIGDSTVGGLVGFNTDGYAIISNTYSVGNVSGNYNVGGLVGENEGNIYYSYWDKETSGQTTSAGGKGKTTVEMKNNDTYARWSTEGWYIDPGINNGYPYLEWQNPGGTPMQPSLSATAPSAGDGSPENPYQISTFENLTWITLNKSEWDKNYIQTANISAAITSTWFDGEGWLEIGTYGNPFKGSYNGQGYIIDSLFINKPNTSYQGFFGSIGSDSVSNLGVINAQITGKDYVGGLSGSISSDLIRCYSTGSISGEDYVGGLVGRIYGSLNECYFNGSVTGDKYVGGLNGYFVSNLSVINCYSIGNVTGSIFVGGLIGYNGYNSISYCYSSVEVKGDSAVGGLIGIGSSPRFPSEVISSFWDIDISGQTVSDGGTGKTTIQMKLGETYIYEGWDASVWNMDEEINNGYPYLKWQNPGGTPLTSPLAIAPPSSGDGTARNPYEIATLENLTWLALKNSKWDKHYIQTENISVAPSKYWYDGDGWAPIGNEITPFTGFYDGQGYTIDSIYINKPGYDDQGLIGYAVKSVISNVVVTNANITANNNVGGLIGYNKEGKIENSYASGNVTGNENTGGFIGFNDTLSAITKCYAFGNTTGQKHVGGLVGKNTSGSIIESYSNTVVTGQLRAGGLVGYNYLSGIITDCYSTGSVTGSTNIAGLVGVSTEKSSITNCYSVGSVTGDSSGIGGLTGLSTNMSSITSSFWDIESSGQNSSSLGGIGKTTSEMKTNTTFLDAGWSEDIWNMDSEINNGYPYLKWQNPDGSPLPVEGETELPKVFSLHQNYPNPFNPSTVIKYELPKNSEVNLKIFDMLGREVATLVDIKQPAGNYEVKFDASHLASGVYLYRLTAGDFVAVKKLMLLK